MSYGTFKFKETCLRLDQIQMISPLNSKTEGEDGFYQMFMRSHKWNMRSQYNFTIYFVEKGGYKEFFSKTVEYVGLENFKGDAKFVDQYHALVSKWEMYHDK